MVPITLRSFMNTMASRGFTKIYSDRDHLEFVTEADRTGAIDSMIADYSPAHDAYACILTTSGKVTTFQVRTLRDLLDGLVPNWAHKRFLDRMS